MKTDLTDLDALARLAYEASGQQKMLLYRAIAEIEVLRMSVGAYEAYHKAKVKQIKDELSLLSGHGRMN